MVAEFTDKTNVSNLVLAQFEIRGASRRPYNRGMIVES